MPRTLSPRMKQIVKDSTGFTPEEIRSKSVDELNSAIEKKVGHELKYAHEPGIHARGSVLISQDRIITPSQVAKKLR